jgi:hypothetical protein
MDWRCSSSGRVPALQALNPKFKPYYCQKKRKRRKKERRKEENKPQSLPFESIASVVD